MDRRVLLCPLVVLVMGVRAGQTGTPAAEKPSSPIRLKAEPFPLSAVQLLRGPLKDAQERNRAYLLSLDLDRLLHNFRVNAGLASGAKPLGGWEAPEVELRGHFVGHFLSASALAYAATGDKRLKTRADHIVAELAICQRLLGPGGYLSAFPEEFIDRVETGKKVWAPWYTLHKIAAGLLDMYRYCQNSQALGVLTSMAAWAKQRTDRLDDARMQIMLTVEHGGMSEVLRNLYAVTHNPDHLYLARRFDHRAFLGPLNEHRDELKGLHANTNIPKVIGAARGYELTGDTSAYDAAMFFWDQIVRGRSYCTGGTSNYEYWRSDPHQLSGELSVESHENCCTYNMLRLAEHIFCWTADARVADYYERALFNGILPTQHPTDGAGLMYYVPMVSGMFKMFGLQDSAYWCCTGTGIESFAKLARGIYFHTSDDLFITLFIPSELRWADKGITLRQETDFPERGGTVLTIRTEQPVTAGLHVRIPYWIAAPGPSLRLNGRTLDVRPDAGSYLTISRTWRDGDRVEVSLPMDLRLAWLPGDTSLAAIMYGPLVLVGELGTEGMNRAMQDGFSTAEVDREFSDGAAVRAPQLVVPDKRVASWVKTVPRKTLTFQTVNVGRPKDVTLIPFYRLFGQRYALYWNLVAGGGRADTGRQRPALPPGVVDRAEAGNPDSDREHNFQAYRPDTGSTNGSRWVQSAYWLRYDLDVQPARSLQLKCSFADDERDCSFDIVIDGLQLRSEALARSTRGSVVVAAYAIPPELVLGKHRIAVKFRAKESKPTARVCACEIVRVE